MKRILALFVGVFFVVSCGGGSGDSTGSVMESTEPKIMEPEMPEPENSPDFEEIEIPTSFMSESDTQPDAGLVPEEMIEMFSNALTVESARTELVRRTSEASPCGALDDWTNEQIWDDMVYQFNLDNLGEWGNNLEDALRNTLAHDLPLDRWEEDYSRPEWSEFEMTHGVAWVVLSEELGRCWDR